jgi:hypothetical protein
MEIAEVAGVIVIKDGRQREFFTLFRDENGSTGVGKGCEADTSATRGAVFGG